MSSDEEGSMECEHEASAEHQVPKEKKHKHHHKRQLEEPAESSLGKKQKKQESEVVPSEEKETPAGPTASSGKTKIVAGELKADLGNDRWLTVREFKGKRYVDIREFYHKESEVLPGKKGISLKPEQWATLMQCAPDIDKFLSGKK